MATATDYASPPPATFSRSSSLSVAARSPDTASPIYPERAIRPLPRSRLKSKLSPEQASSIVFPPDPPPISPTLTFSSPAAIHHHQQQDGGSRLLSSAQINGDIAQHQGPGASAHHHHHHVHEYADVEHDHCTCGGEEGDSGDEDAEFDHPQYRYSAPAYGANGLPVPPELVADGRAEQQQQQQQPRRPGGGGGEPAALRLSPNNHNSAAPGSAASSADGYESFENTSNKKKRKIPLSGTGGSMHQSQLSAEMASMGISGGGVDGAADDVGDAGGVALQQQAQQQQQQGGSNGRNASYGGGVGISGAGRGRYGRQNSRNEHAIRRPLASSNVNVHGYNSRLPAKNGWEVKTSDVDIENSHTGGIISEAINRAAEQGPLTPQGASGHDNPSLLPSSVSSATATSASASNSKTQFTFAVQSESASKMADQQQQQHPASYGSPTPGARTPNGAPVQSRPANVSTHGTQTTPPQRGGTVGGPQQGGHHNPNARGVPPPAPPGGSGQQEPLDPAAAGAAADQRPRRPRRRPSKEYALAARQRRLQQEYTNFHHKPTKDNIWICEFCEYEDLFGVPPKALIRQYEIKDRQERKRMAEKRRLLEKARAKGRKNKKGGKNKNGNNGGGNGAGGAAGGAAAAAGAGGAGGGGVPGGHTDYDPALDPPDGEDYYEDGYEGDDYEPVGPEDHQYAADYYPPPQPPPAASDGVGRGGGISSGKFSAAAG